MSYRAALVVSTVLSLGIVAAACGTAVDNPAADRSTSPVDTTAPSPDTSAPSGPPTTETALTTISSTTTSSTTTSSTTAEPPDDSRVDLSELWSEECEDAVSELLTFEQELIDIAAGWDIATAMDPKLEALIADDPALTARVEELETLVEGCDRGAFAIRSVARSEELEAGNLSATIFKAVILKTSLESIGYGDPAVIDELAGLDTLGETARLEEPDWRATSTCRNLQDTESEFLSDLLAQADSLNFVGLFERGISAPDTWSVLEGFEYQRLLLGCDLEAALMEHVSDVGDYPAASFLAIVRKHSLINSYLDDQLGDLVGKDPNWILVDLVVEPKTFDAFLVVINPSNQRLDDLSISLNGVVVVAGESVQPNALEAFPASVESSATGWRWDYEYTTESGDTSWGSGARF